MEGNFQEERTSFPGSHVLLLFLADCMCIETSSQALSQVCAQSAPSPLSAQPGTVMYKAWLSRCGHWYTLGLRLQWFPSPLHVPTCKPWLTCTPEGVSYSLLSTDSTYHSLCTTLPVSGLQIPWLTLCSCPSASGHLYPKKLFPHTYDCGPALTRAT